MMDKEVIKYCLDSLTKAGAEKAQCVLKKNRKYELNLEGHKFSLLRTTFDTDLSLTVIKDSKRGHISINKLDKEAVDKAVNSVMELCKTSQVDGAYDISPQQETKDFLKGDSEPDLDKMYDLLKGYISAAKESFPKIKLMETVLSFNCSIRFFANTNGVDFTEKIGYYKFYSIFTAREGEKSSSFNNTGFMMSELEKELLDAGSLRILLEQAAGQLNTETIRGKFLGDVIITPDCMNEFIAHYVDSYLTDKALISGTSVLKDKLNLKIANEKLTLHSKPTSSEISTGYFVTQDGFEAEDVTVIDKGILRSFLLSQYGANKTGLSRARNNGSAYIIEPGDKKLDEIIKEVQKGILVSRFSGARPNPGGDFSGVAKNSYYIENGEIKYPVSEVMIAGNLYELFRSIVDISEERIDFGMSILPWVCCSGVTISGK